ncbi:hypothetical protein BAUCODRAFT_118985 [Baudoinia panamericana UAMH 10762]|uniref:Uncharacterized protein n=1 Tax=Baudoinia panamericana (strain UAMH 10762) TaxID=717646 RepID=M2NQF8_BAUPA|nr:uncharacterized protein BAUCODRAFT_118985 [Baudoinia panamericana UAMH 10762]EMD01286.1 hypothetical protein BAUCODRAFT_118985 [Baudoinia panamericana UAMH 10762]
MVAASVGIADCDVCYLNSACKDFTPKSMHLMKSVDKLKGRELYSSGPVWIRKAERMEDEDKKAKDPARIW